MFIDIRDQEYKRLRAEALGEDVPIVAKIVVNVPLSSLPLLDIDLRARFGGQYAGYSVDGDRVILLLNNAEIAEAVTEAATSYNPFVQTFRYHPTKSAIKGKVKELWRPITNGWRAI